MPTPDPDANESWYRARMAAHRRGLVRLWPLAFVALGVAIVLGIVSPDRSKPSPLPHAAAASEK